MGGDSTGYVASSSMATMQAMMPTQSDSAPGVAVASCAGSAFEALLGASAQAQAHPLQRSVSADPAPKRARVHASAAQLLPRPPSPRPSGGVALEGDGADQPGSGSPGAFNTEAATPSFPSAPSAPSSDRFAARLLHGCRSVERFRKLNRIDEGTYGVVYRARDTATGEVVALKQLKLSAAKSEEGFPVSSLREVILLSKMSHPNVVCLKEVVVGSSPLHIFMVMEYAEHELRALLERHSFAVAEVKCLMKQLLRGVAHLHDRWVIHRDLKTSNILLTNKGVLKVCDFGLARHFGSPLRTYTRNVITMWYRAPELIMGQRQYSTGVDIWSVGCIFGELFLRKPLFAGKSELHQLTLIYELVGVPTEETWPGYEALPNRKHFDMKLSLPRWRIVFPEPPEGLLTAMGLELLRSLLTCCPERRPSAEAAEEDPYFWERPYALEPGMMPTFQDTNSTGRAEKRPTNFQGGPPAAMAAAMLLDNLSRARCAPF